MLRPLTSEARVRPSRQSNHRLVPSPVAPTPTTPGSVARGRHRFRTEAGPSQSRHLLPARQLAPVKFSLTDFARQFVREPGATGAIAPSSRSLARQVVMQAKLHNANTVVELGPGTGVFTEQIVENLHERSLFFAIELNQAFVAATRNRCPKACIYHGGASALPALLKRNKRSHADCIVSSLPWTLFDESAQDEILQAITDSLAPGGVFVSIVYLGARFRSRGRYFINGLQDHFSSVTCTPTVWQNLPPSQIYRCTK